MVREYIDGLDLETLMKNPSLCPSLRSPEKRMAISVGRYFYGVDTLVNLEEKDLRNFQRNILR